MVPSMSTMYTTQLTTFIKENLLYTQGNVWRTSSCIKFDNCPHNYQ